MSTIKCTFHHVFNDAVESISSLLGISVKYDKKKNELYHSCSPANVESVRSVFTKLRQQYPQIWLSIPPIKKSASGFFPFNQNIGTEIHVSFGALLSTSKVFIHDISLNNQNLCQAIFPNEHAFVIECIVNEKMNRLIRLTLPMKCIGKTILVIENGTYSEIIFNLQTITGDVRFIENENNERLYGNHRLIELLSRCRDLLIRISSKTDADQFLEYLVAKHSCQIFYTNISIEQYSEEFWDKIEFNWYSTDEALYGISMLHSLGYLFDDKYMTNSSLQSIMVTLAEENEKQFYQLTVKAYIQLEKNHWLDLTTIYNENEFKKIQIQTNTSSHYVGVVCITPTYCSIKPKEETIGNRAMRHKLFHGENHFCLVNLIPDLSSDMYLTNDANALEYFHQIFETGLEIGRERYHLFGSSNSQIKKHSFWFIKANSLNEINDKRLQLGQFNTIDNLGTYVARLGLWFSKSSPTGIELVYCQNLDEFNQRVQQKEICVVEINDIERNGFCFTDGNGFISKGLAKRVAENLFLCSKTSPDIIPSAYQIRIAGCKGLLIIDPQSTFEQFYIKIRKSMRKFESNDWSLDICEISRATPTSLNNQIILLLSDLGVSNETFLRLQKQWFDRKPSTYTYSDDLVKNKIPLPNNECRFMYGCAFESRLQPGTCFIRYEVLNEQKKSLPNRQFQCVQGRVIVTKNPCPYAGDLLELTAVDLPELHCLSDVIVFSTTDNRPDCNKIAGSDLDGDQYFVYWGGEFQLQRSVRPLDYTGDAKITHPTPIQPIDVINYCLSTIGATSYGEIYNLHAVVVDKNEEKHPQPTCQKTAIELARMFSSAIDSGKTGYQIDRKRIQELREMYGQQYPDFLMKYQKPYYKSQSIIGQLYRNAVLYKKGNIEKLNNLFSKLGLDENQLENVAQMPLNSLPVNTSTQLSNSERKEKNSRSYSGRKSLK